MLVDEADYGRPRIASRTANSCADTLRLQIHPRKAPKKKLEIHTSKKWTQRAESGKKKLGTNRGATPLRIANTVPTMAEAFQPSKRIINCRSSFFHGIAQTFKL